MSQSQPDFYETFPPISVQQCLFVQRQVLVAIDHGNYAEARSMLASLTRDIATDEGIYEWIETKAEKGELYVRQ